MLKPSLEELKKLAPGHTAIPVSREIYADIRTPIALLKSIRSLSNRCFLLESVEGGEVWGRYSFLGFDPVTHLTCKDGEIMIKNGTTIRMSGKRPQEIIRDVLSQYKTPKFDHLPPFTGGVVGYFSYDYIRYCEDALKFTSPDDAAFNDFDLMLFDKVIAYDHLRQKIVIIVNIRTDDPEANYRRAGFEIDSIVRMIRDNTPREDGVSMLETDLECDIDQEAFESMVEKAKKYIFEGDIFQVVLSRRFKAKMAGSLLDAYRVLRTTNPSPYMFYVKSDDVELAGTSPETLVKLQDGKLSTFPLAGTRPRGKTPDEDRLLEAELLTDEKELSEHNMLVDLGRNDLGRISAFGSVEVQDYLKILRFSHVMHIASVVTGTIREDMDALDAIGSVLPAGTLSGAPKIRACQIIDELEPVRRGVYGGAVGYIDFSGNMDTCIGIRMAAKKGDTVYVQAGAGIVADSVPEREFQECGNKAMAVIGALRLSREVAEQ